jgi:hypothetical protein
MINILHNLDFVLSQKRQFFRRNFRRKYLKNHNIGKNANFFAEKWQKSQKIGIITSTPGHPVGNVGKKIDRKFFANRFGCQLFVSGFRVLQGCQIFIDTIYQNGRKNTK